jgi:CRISPR type III-B/RAMP module-associated protein Cmr3
MAVSSWLAFTPRDTVFVRDGRSFDASADATGESVRPGPTTIAGAVGAAFRTNPAEVRGPVLARRDGDTWEPYFPVPADLVVTAAESGRVYRMAPDADGVTDVGDGGLRFLVAPEHAEPVKPLTGWLSAGRLLEYLKDELPGPRGMAKRDLRLAEPLVPERRVGLARDERRVKEGFLYQATHLRPRDGWAFLAEYTAPEKWSAEASSHGPFGGRGRLADIEPAAMRWPDATAAIGKRVLVYLATPALWPDGWRLPVPDGAELVAAATGEPEPAATVKRDQDKWLDSRVLRWAVPAGSVYLLEFADPAAGAAWARKWNGVALARGDEAVMDRDLLRTAGFGVVLTGAWT